MLRATKIRLIIDVCIQLVLFILLAIQLFINPTWDCLLFYLSIFGILLSFWQLAHAFYVVKKYKDWQRRQYIYYMRQVLAYSLLTVAVGAFMLLVSFGFLVPFFLFTINILHWILCGVVLFLAINYFRISFYRLYNYFYQPKSFWDLK